MPVQSCDRSLCTAIPFWSLTGPHVHQFYCGHVTGACAAVLLWSRNRGLSAGERLSMPIVFVTAKGVCAFWQL
uniref:Uncharacterized protein n=1 Tax=Anguilla anguilla TaxID=7936 RepID=A0A0E9WLJ4_ANGAN